MIKHLFSDLDGTLLNNNGELSDYTKKIIGECKISAKNGKYFK